MLSLKQKKDQLAHLLRQKQRQNFRKQIRQNMVDKLYNEQNLLLSSTLEMFSHLTLFELSQHQQKILETLSTINFQSITDEEQYYLVTDLFFLLHQHIIPEPNFLRFKKNQDSYTASLVAYLASEIIPQELVYWSNFMDQDSKMLMLTTIEAADQSHKKWVLNNQLFKILLESLKLYKEAALAFNDIIINSEQIGKKQIDESVLYIHKAIQSANNHEDESLRICLLEIWMNIIQIYLKLKERQTKIQFMITVLKHQLNKNIRIFQNKDILSAINHLCEQRLDIYLSEDSLCEKILENTFSKLDKLSIIEDKEGISYFFNSLFRLCYNNWLARHAFTKNYQYSKNFYEVLRKLQAVGEGNVWYIKLWKTLD